MPGYNDMTLDQLNAVSAEHWLALLALRARMRPDMTADERLALELECAQHRAHYNAVQPRRTELFRIAEARRSDQIRRMAGLSDAEWDDLRQMVEVERAEQGAIIHEPGD